MLHDSYVTEHVLYSINDIEVRKVVWYVMPSSVDRNHISKKPAASVDRNHISKKPAASVFKVGSSTPKIDEEGSCASFAPAYQTTRRHITEDVVFITKTSNPTL
jgi:hypothetical protein